MIIGREKINCFHGFVLFLILASFVLRVPILFLRCFCPDELQHLHATWSIAHGMVPYRDFFEHHTPFLHFFLVPAYAIFGNRISTIFFCRGVMLLFTGGIIYLIYRLGKMMYGVNVGLIGALFASYNMMFLDKTIEIRPDLPGMLFWLLTLLFFIIGIKSKRRVHYAFSGGMISLAILSTQKVLFGGIGLFLSVIWLLLDRRIENTIKELAKSISWIVLGFIIPFVIICIYFGVNHALDDFIYNNFIMNFRWRHEVALRDVVRVYVLYNIRQNPFFSVFSLAGLVIATYRLKLQSDILRGTFAPVISTYALIGGIFLIPEAYPQYFVFFLILLSIFCGLTVATMMNYLSLTEFKVILRKRKSDFFAYSLVGVASLCGLGYILIYSKPKLPFLSRPDGEFLCSLASWPASKQVPHSELFYITSWLILLSLAICVSLYKQKGYGNFISKRQLVTLLLLLGIFMYPVAEMVSQVKRTNTLILQEIKFVLDNTTENDYIIDGFHGAGVFRPHTYYYHFLHIGVRMMLTEKQLSTDIISAMQKKRPKIVVYDENLKATSETVRQYVSRNYIPTGVGYIYILKE